MLKLSLVFCSLDFGAFQHTLKYKGKPGVQRNVTIKSVVKKFEMSSEEGTLVKVPVLLGKRRLLSILRLAAAVSAETLERRLHLLQWALQLVQWLPCLVEGQETAQESLEESVSLL